MNDLPPRQVETALWPVIGERDPEPFDRGTWSLRISGAVERALSFSFEELAALPRTERRDDIHCVTRWTRRGAAFRGVPVETLLDAAGVLASARFVRFASGRGHDTSLPIDVVRGDVLVALEHEERGRFAPVPPGHGGPVRSVVFRRYFYKSVKWLRQIEVLAEDRLGFWERTAGYHNEADPWKEQRYVARGTDRTELARRLASRRLAGMDLLGADLTGLDLAGFDLSAASLRNAKLDRANLRGADLAGANFTNASLMAADLRGARIHGADFDGADLRAADLRGATGAPASLAVTSLAAAEGVTGAEVIGLDWSDAPVEGLLPRDLAHLRAAGVRIPPER